MLQAIVDYAFAIQQFFQVGIYEFVTDAFAQFVIWSTISAIEFKIFILVFSWDVAQSVMSQLDISGYIQTAYSSLDSDVASIVGFLGIPEAINTIMSAAVTRYILDFVKL